MFDPEETEDFLKSLAVQDDINSTKQKFSDLEKEFISEIFKKFTDLNINTMKEANIDDIIQKLNIFLKENLKSVKCMVKEMDNTPENLPKFIEVYFYGYDEIYSIALNK